MRPLPPPFRRPAAWLVNAVHGFVRAAGAVHPGTGLADTFGSFGKGSLINFPMATLFGAGSIHIGSDTLIGPHTAMSVGHAPDDANVPARGLVIGDRCVIGARAIITAHGSIEIGDDVWFGQSVFVSDSGHGYVDPETPIGLQLAEHDPVVIGSGSWIGHGAIILPGARIGRNVVVGAGSVVRGVVPDHTIVAGVPAKVVRRLEPGVGWVPTNASGTVRPAMTTAEVAALLAGEG